LLFYRALLGAGFLGGFLRRCRLGLFGGFLRGLLGLLRRLLCGLLRRFLGRFLGRFLRGFLPCRQKLFLVFFILFAFSHRDPPVAADQCLSSVSSRSPLKSF